MSEFNHLSGRQIAAARALLGIGQAELAAMSNISAPTLRRMEASEDKIVAVPNNIAAVKTALEAAGVTFIDAGDVAEGPGVTLRP
jgi:transcriptional regulator with XRE-family HTH domain